MQLLNEVDQGRCKCYKPWLKAEDDNACRAVGRSWVSRCARSRLLFIFA